MNKKICGVGRETVVAEFEEGKYLEHLEKKIKSVYRSRPCEFIYIKLNYSFLVSPITKKVLC